MFDLFLLMIGRCPWCSDRESPIRDWLGNHLPYRMYAGFRVGGWDYNHWIGEVASPLHCRHLTEEN
jgi:hypothetical protein